MKISFWLIDLYYDRIDISEEIDPAKSNSSNECMVCHYWFLNHGFKFQDTLYNDCDVVS